MTLVVIILVKILEFLMTKGNDVIRKELKVQPTIKHLNLTKNGIMFYYMAGK